MEESKSKVPRVLSVFTLAMINVAAIGSVKNWPVTAEYGFSSIFYFVLAALIFFLADFLRCRRTGDGMAEKRRGVRLGQRGIWPSDRLFSNLAVMDRKCDLVSDDFIFHRRDHRLYFRPLSFK